MTGRTPIDLVESLRCCCNLVYNLILAFPHLPASSLADTVTSNFLVIVCHPSQTAVHLRLHGYYAHEETSFGSQNIL